MSIINSRIRIKRGTATQIANNTTNTLPAGTPLYNATENTLYVGNGDALEDIVPITVADNAIVTAKINDSAVTTSKINDLAVTTEKIADSAILTEKINDLAVTTAKINDLGVTVGKINDLAVTTDKINTNAVTEAKLADDIVKDNFTAGYSKQIMSTSDNIAKNIWTGTTSQYNAISTKDSNTLYFIYGD